MKTTTLNIAILPSDEIARQVVAMSKKINKEIGSKFVLNSKTLIPHITVYQAQYPNKNIEKLKNITRNLALEQELFKIELNAICVSYETFLFWECEKSPLLSSLQKEAVKLANPLREGLIPDQLTSMNINLSKGDAYDIGHYGALLIGSRYKPHITITRLTTESDGEKAVKALASSQKLSFKPKALILGYLGEHGTATGIVEKFSFR